jgi:hypothetical protein
MLDDFEKVPIFMKEFPHMLDPFQHRFEGSGLKGIGRQRDRRCGGQRGSTYLRWGLPLTPALSPSGGEGAFSILGKSCGIPLPDEAPQFQGSVAELHGSTSRRMFKAR